MNLKFRPMSEAPVGEDILLQYSDGTFAVHALGEGRMTSAIGFYEISNLLRAAQILDEITPDGYEYSDLDSAALYEISASRRVYFRRIPPPVEYEYVTDGVKRTPRVGDWLPQLDQWIEVKAISASALAELCYRRVEVKR